LRGSAYARPRPWVHEFPTHHRWDVSTRNVDYNNRPQSAAWIPLLTNSHFFLSILLPIVKNTRIFLLPQSSRRRNRLPPPSPLHLFSQAFCFFIFFCHERNKREGPAFLMRERERERGEVSSIDGAKTHQKARDCFA